MCRYDIVISNKLVGFYLDLLFFLLAVILSKLHVKPGRKDWVTAKKVHRKICAKDITFLTARPPFYVTFCCFLLNTRNSEKAIYFLLLMSCLISKLKCQMSFTLETLVDFFSDSTYVLRSKVSNSSFKALLKQTFYQTR